MVPSGKHWPNGAPRNAMATRKAGIGSGWNDRTKSETPSLQSTASGISCRRRFAAAGRIIDTAKTCRFRGWRAQRLPELASG